MVATLKDLVLGRSAKKEPQIEVWDLTHSERNSGRDQWWTDSTDDLKALAAKEIEPVKKSRIRVELSRPLTWAEKEYLETDHLDPHARRIDGTDGLKLTVSSDFQHVVAEAEYGSRILFELIASALEHSFVNVFPTAVRTFREYNGE